MLPYRIGQKATRRRRFEAGDVVGYRALTGDPGPPSSRDTVPQALLGGMFSQLLGTELPGRGTNWLKQTLRFPEPAHVGDEITATVEIVRLRPEKRLIYLRTTCVDSSGRVVCDGEALMLALEMMMGG